MKKKLIGIDYLTFFLILWNMAYAAVGWNRINAPLPHIVTYFSIGVGIIFLIWLESVYSIPLIRFIRDAYPIFLFGYFFESTSHVNHVIFQNFLDPWFQNIDQVIFNYQPSLVWGMIYKGAVVQEIMHFSYFSYYLMIAGIPIYLYLKNRKAFHETIFAITFVFYFCYFIYSWLPVVGGRYFPEAKQISTVYQDGIFTRIMAYIYTESPHMGGAFPSSHVAISVVITWAALRYMKKIGYILVPITFLLCLSTVHCHYHYFIDILAGLFTSLLLYPIAILLYRKWPVSITENMPSAQPAKK
ncbi:MAG TPA: phosphatase PAP2 family protein [Candidatus Cloacimonadota bacterium]|nr:phosphatase PAP2 family protein [Candidatus Cloacimonadota bacterium]HPT72884.1 phosphatase PAP2 family protein [Candidatus Cloacimonadota bacterium]